MSEQAHVLLIDDDPDMHAAVRMILEPVGYRVTCCPTGPLGLDTLESDPPDLLLLDVMLATLSEGIQLAYHIRRQPQLEQVPIIMVSALAEQVGIDYGADVGSEFLPVEAFLDKPFTAEALRTAIATALAKASSATE